MIILSSKFKFIAVVTIAILLVSSFNLQAKTDYNYQDVELEEEGLEMNFQQTEINEAFRLLAETTDMNIVTTADLTGKVTLFLNSVSFFEALDILTKQQSLEYKIMNNTVLVGPADKILSGFNNKITKIYHLQNAEPQEVKLAINHLVTAGEIKINERMNTVMITSYEKVIEELENIIISLDQARRQISIKVRFQEISHNEAERLGIDWSFSDFNILGVDGSLDFGDLDVGFPKLNYVETLEFLEKEGSAEMLSNPSLTTIEGQKAEISIGDEIPIVESKTFDNDGNEVVDIGSQEVGISLAVTPRITEEDNVLIELAPEVTDIVNMVQIAGNQYPEISVKRLNTTVEVKDGETIVLGGLIQHAKLKNESRVPVLNRIPLLGRLFRSENFELDKRELVIFITPEIITNHTYNFNNL